MTPLLVSRLFEIIRLVMDQSEARGGHNVGPMGAEALLASLGGCFMSNLRAAIAARDNICVSGIALSSTATVATDQARFSAIHMQVNAEADPIQRQELVTIADRSCIAANALRGALELTVSVG